MKLNDLISQVTKLITDGEDIISRQFENKITTYLTKRYVPLEDFERWRGNCKVLVSILGTKSRPWELTFTKETNNELVHAVSIQGALKSMHDSMSAGLLLKIADIVMAETFANLLEQAEYLFEKGYWMPAGVIGRSVLEESLRRYCETQSCLPEKERPTLADYNSALYKNEFYDKIEFKNIDALSAIGNECAHAKEVSQERVKQLIEQVGQTILRLGNK